jgi:heme/copper-type cytochrome/quinol oxidase subunit 2
MTENMTHPALNLDLAVTEQQLVAIKPFSAANAATIVMLVMSIPAFCLMKFFQYFDPNPPPPVVSTGKALMVWAAALFLILVVTYVFTARAALAFNASSRLTGGVKLKTRALASRP